jgi:hypothetical protein
MITRLLTLRRRGLLVFAAFLAVDVGIALAACSSSSPDATTDGTDATSEGTAPPVDGGKDAPITRPDSGSGDGGGGNCSVVKGGCDIVLQDCPPQQECVVDNSGVTVCQPVQAAQQLERGRACCPNTAGNPCLPGLTCVGSACVDGGPATARCSPACCKGDDQHCGASVPEGIAGACDITLVDPTTSKELYQVCTYRQKCEPFQVQPCKLGETCLVEDMAGTASCVTSAAKTDRQPCTFGNECADGLICLGAADASVCHYACLFPGSANPFDAGVQNGGPGAGGCPANQICTLQIQDLPAWYAACSLDGG